MKFKKNLTTVTPLSKSIALSFFILLPIGTLLFGISLGNRGVVIIEESTSVVSPSSDISLFKSPTYPYSVQIPPQFFQIKESDISGEFERYVFESTNETDSVNTIIIGGKPGALPDPQKMYIDKNGNEKISVVLIFAGMEGISISLPTGQGGGEESSIPRVEVYAEKNGIVYGFTFFGTSDVNDPTIKQILNTFELTT